MISRNRRTLFSGFSLVAVAITAFLVTHNATPVQPATAQPSLDPLDDVPLVTVGRNDVASAERTLELANTGYSRELRTLSWQSRLSAPAQLVPRRRHRIRKESPLIDRYDELVNLAMAGDSQAAIELAASLLFCLQAPRNDRHLSELINFTNRTRRIAGYARQVDNLDAAILIANEIIERDNCCWFFERLDN
jgi:hypothetical protein